MAPARRKAGRKSAGRKKGSNPNVCGARLIAFKRCRSFAANRFICARYAWQLAHRALGQLLARALFDSALDVPGLPDFSGLQLGDKFLCYRPAHRRLAQQIAAKEHPVGDFVLVEMTAEIGVGKWSQRCGSCSQFN